MVLNELEVRQKLEDLPDWITNGQAISHMYKFKDFLEAIDFVNRLVEPAESLGHHPDLEISFNKVTVRLSTHDAGGITQKDFDLAYQVAAIASKFLGN